MLLIKKLPVPITGLALGIIILNSLLSKYSPFVTYITTILASTIIILISLQMILYPEIFKKQISNPAVGGVFATYFMTIVLLASIYQTISSSFALILWLIGSISHFIYLVVFSIKYFKDFSLSNVMPSWFIVYVGIVVIANTSKVFGLINFGKLIFIIGIILFITMFFLITLRIIKTESLPKPLKPLYIIYTAPLNLCIVGYFTLFEDINKTLLIILLILSFIIFISTLIVLAKIIKYGFFPSYSALTFPYVITSIAYKLSLQYFNINNFFLIKILEVFSIFVLLYVTYKYIMYLTKEIKLSIELST